MADPFSISASILTVLQVAASLVSLIRDLKDASRELKKLQLEIEGLQTILSRVKDLSEKTETPEEQTEKVVCSHAPLQECLAQLTKLMEKFSPVRGVIRPSRAISWKLQQGEIKQAIASIERQKTLLIVGLQVDTQSLCYTTNTLCLQNQSSISSLQADIATLKDASITEAGQSSSNYIQDAIQYSKMLVAEPQDINAYRATGPSRLPENAELPAYLYRTTGPSSDEVFGAESSSTPFHATAYNDAARVTVIHRGNNYNGANVVYGGCQVFSGATICFGQG
ncbi:hypothetical protein LTR84_003670 [Exophiala bonariae]|uniref:Azaphilone pigments biosynthesis cluster protein L N-terminal domain-containing protein n=1 Tax=Exophiala bonariae TaxID=1690606 RepID=A0AAV9N5S5_9EURO|nr:hypothetical protein LTR84_003670 [Exophiala bonariae]